MVSRMLHVQPTIVHKMKQITAIWDGISCIHVPPPAPDSWLLHSGQYKYRGEKVSGACKRQAILLICSSRSFLDVKISNKCKMFTTDIQNYINFFLLQERSVPGVSGVVPDGLCQVSIISIMIPDLRCQVSIISIMIPKRQCHVSNKRTCTTETMNGQYYWSSDNR